MDLFEGQILWASFFWCELLEMQDKGYLKIYFNVTIKKKSPDS